jgi:hypothetical protein
MRPGDTAEASWWLTGKELPEAVNKAHGMLSECIGEICSLAGVMHGAVTFEELPLADEEVAQFSRTYGIPDWVNGPNVRLLRGTARVLGYYERDTGFAHELDRKGLEHLRTITRREYARAHPGQRLTDIEADDYINEHGPDVALDQLRRG